MEIRKVDIVIPIYNAYEDLQLCIASIKKYTDLSVHTLVLINDKSPDKRIKPYLDQMAGEMIRVIHNEENRGFSGNINLGMSISDHDVILLNSDTIVTPDWVEKMLDCAYREERIATVTPLSNNATLCSVPNFCEENKIPEGMEINDMAQIVEMASVKEFPEIPTAHGFCMLVKREVIREIGNFDVETFGRGYGEENDFCYRAIQAGYYHVMCDNVFIYHKGTSSFVSEEKMRYIREHEKVLEQRYPMEVRNTHMHCMTNPNQFLFDNVANFIKLWGNKKNILYLMRSDFREDTSDNRGGTQFHVKDLTMAFRKEYNVFVLARDFEYLNLTIYTKEDSILYRYYIGTKEAYPVFSNRKLKELYGEILDVFQIERVHIHHTDTLSLEMFYAAEERKIPIITTLHDYYFACPNVKMLDYQDRLCIGKENPANCEMCLQTSLHICGKVDYLAIWRKKSREVLQKSVQIVVPSSSAKQIIGSYFPELQEKICVIEHGSDGYEKKDTKVELESAAITHNVKTYIEELQIKKERALLIKGWTFEDGQNMGKCDIWAEIEDAKQNIRMWKAKKVRRDDVTQGDIKKRYSGIRFCVPIQEAAEGILNIRILIQNEEGQVKTNGEIYHIRKKEVFQKDTFHVAFIGGLSTAKGAKLAYDLILNSSEAISWFIFGDIGYEKLRELKQKNLVKTGSYDREDLGELLNGFQIDLVCILPIWPETFCYTLSEAILCKVPVLVTEIGALKERMEKLQCGWSVAADASWKDMLAVIERIRKDESEYKNVKQRFEEIKLRNVEEMAADYRKLYQDCILKDINWKECTAERKKYILNPAYLASTSVSVPGSRMGEVINIEEFQLLKEKERELQQIENSVTYGVAKKLAGMHFPGKMKMRNLFYRLKNRKK